MEDWHMKKSESCTTLCESIKSRGWLVSFFAVEVGARGYCAKNVVPTLLQLGFTSKLAHRTGKEVSLISMQASFCIWLASNSHEWIQPPLVGTHGNPIENPQVESTEVNSCETTATMNQTLLPSNSVPSSVSRVKSLYPTALENKETSNLIREPAKPQADETSISSPQKLNSPEILPQKSKANIHPPRCPIRTRHQRPAGLANLGSTCYANALLQAFRCIPEFLSLN